MVLTTRNSGKYLDKRWQERRDAYSKYKVGISPTDTFYYEIGDNEGNIYGKEHFQHPRPNLEPMKHGEVVADYRDDDPRMPKKFK